MVLAVIASLVLGVISGKFFFPPEWIALSDRLASIALVLLILSIGIDVGMRRDVFQKMKEYHIKVFLIPFGVVAGSLLLGTLCGVLMGIDAPTSAAISAGMGWYSLSSVLLKDLAGVQAGTLSLLSNLFREIFSFILIPFLAKYISPYTAVASAAATSEDTTLAFIGKYTTADVTVMAVINGVICSALVPVLTPLVYDVLSIFC